MSRSFASISNTYDLIQERRYEQALEDECEHEWEPFRAETITGRVVEGERCVICGEVVYDA